MMSAVVMCLNNNILKPLIETSWETLMLETHLRLLFVKGLQKYFTFQGNFLNYCQNQSNNEEFAVYKESL